MRRRILIVLLSLGVVGGFGSGIAHLAHCRGHHRARREAFERHVAQVCTQAALDATRRGAPPPRDEPPARTP
ncbi:MAG: hypothetical protein HY909_27960 [Deltaproteobacteria bacterium]|nr:hypothetical protein [Deltaproteobacteria bacterium]